MTQNNNTHTNLNMNTTPIQPSDFDQPTAVIRLTGKDVKSILDKPFELYERTRSAWAASPNGKIAKTTLVLAAYHGVVIECYAVAGWFRSNAIMRLGLKTTCASRLAFVGNLASDHVRAKFAGRSVGKLFKKGAVFPVVTFGI